MAVPFWQPGTLYQPGDIVQPITAPAPTAAQVVNGDFSAGNANWDFTGGAEFSTTGGYANNGPCVTMPGSVPDGLALNRSKLVVPSSGSTFEASAMIQQGAAIAGATRGWVEVQWFDADDNFLLSERGNVVSDGSGGLWKKSTVTATRPANGAYARAGIGLFSVADHTHPIWGDNLTVSGTFGGLPDGLVYRAVQEASGFSAASEPAWPPILGQEVIDNEVTWEAVASTRVTWEASPLYVSGATEPNWPTDVNGYVRDGTLNWRAVSRRVEDENCPNTKVVVIGASKVFCADDDIVRYSATVNPLDWSTANDAGYLPTGLQNYGANPVAAMGLYRGNLIVFNAEAFQLWQIDEDPASMALLDALPMGSTQHHSIAPVSNDLFFLSSQGVRTVGIAASSTNFQAGDVGMPIDPLIKDRMSYLQYTGAPPMGMYYPGQGQYMLAFAKTAQTDVQVLGVLPGAKRVGEYQGSLDVLSAYGAFTVEQVGGDALPAGSAITADSEARKVRVTWPVTTTLPEGVDLLNLSILVRDSAGRTATWSGQIVIMDVSLTFREIMLSYLPAMYLRLGETSGAVAVNETGGTNGVYSGLLTLGNAPLYTGGPTAMKVTGGDARVTWPAAAIPQLPGGMTIGAVVRQGSATNYNYIVNRDSAGVGTQKRFWQLRIIGAIQFINAYGPAPEMVQAETGMSSGALAFLAMSYNRATGSVVFYKNGIAIGPEQFISAGIDFGEVAETPVTIGNFSVGYNDARDDEYLSECFLVPGVLTQGQMFALAQSAGFA